jgi:hypothetical protein
LEVATLPVLKRFAPAPRRSQRRLFLSRFAALLLAVLILCVPAGFGQEKKKGKDPTRSVQGSVTTPEDAPVEGAVVYLKNTKTLQIRSFITQQNGEYYFHALSPDIDYILHAERKDMVSPDKTLSAFDTRKQAIIHLRLAKK